MAVRFTDEELKALKIVKKPYRDTATTINKNPFDESNKDRFSLSAYWVNITCGNYNADVSVVMGGKKGSGKSYSSIELARMCAIRTSIALNNDEGQAWKDYFDIERNVAIMDADKLIDILTSDATHQTIIADDDGTMQGAREYRSKNNMLMNNVQVCNRTANNIMFSSAPEVRHMDRIARDLPEHMCEFQKNEALMSMGLAMCKYFHKSTDAKTSESYHSYHYWKDAQVVRIVIPKPPKEMCEEYDKLREIGRKKVQEALKEMLNEEGEEGEQISAGRRRMESMQEKLSEAQTMMDKMRDSEESNQKKFNRISKAVGVSPYTVKGWYTNGKIC